MVRLGMVVVAALVATSVAIMVGASAWGWRNDTLRETTQERIDDEFDQIVRRLQRHR